MSDIKEQLNAPLRTGSTGLNQEEPGKFPFEAFEFESPTVTNPNLILKDPWDFKCRNIELSEGGSKFYSPVSGEPSLGTIHEYPDSSRGSTWDINGVTDTTWTGRDFSAYCPEGVKMLYLRYAILFTGNGAYDYAMALLRKNGSTETDGDRLYQLVANGPNCPSSVISRGFGHVWVECDEDGIIESLVYGGAGARAAGTLYLQFMDYLI